MIKLAWCPLLDGSSRCWFSNVEAAAAEPNPAADGGVGDRRFIIEVDCCGGGCRGGGGERERDLEK